LVGALWLPAWQDGSLPHSPRLLGGGTILLGMALLPIGALAFSFSSKGGKQVVRLAQGVARRFEHLGRRNLLFIGLLFATCSFWVAGDYSWYFSTVMRRLPLLLLYAGLVALILKAWLTHLGWLKVGSAALLFTAAILRLSVFLAEVTDYPFSLYWSETTRFYYASLFFSERLYGERIAWPPYDASRALLQAIPFLLTGIPLWIHRLWQALLWIGIAVLTAMGVVRRLHSGDAFHRWTLIAATVLWFLLAPVYFQLQLAVWLMCVGLDRRFWERESTMRTFLVLAIASIWSGLSRINWFPMPALIAVLFYTLEKPKDGQTVQQYFFQPILWVLFGSLIAAATQGIYIWLSGAEAHTYGYIFTSKILWYRLLPNPTFPTGILPTAIFVSLPPLIWIGWRMRTQRRQLGFWRGAVLISILAVLFGGGIVVSAKIGGGNNLHNLDAYWVMLWLLSLSLYLGRVTNESRTTTETAKVSLTDVNHPRRAILLAWMIIHLVISTLSSGSPRLLYNRSEAISDLRLLEEAVRTADQQSPVLFLTERHLLTFGTLPHLRLAAQYEKVWLLMMAMAHNQTYMAQFREDIRSQRFSLIVSDPLRLRKKGTTAHFGDENDYWVDEVASYILCYYEPKKLLRTATIRWYVPRPDPLPCP